MSNYDIDVFMDIFKAIQALCPGLRDYQGKVGKEEDPENIDMAYRVVADHIRTLTFAITDGAMPSNEGRGYVLRRILRRAVRYGGEILKAPEGFFHQLVDVVVEVMADGFPELRKNPAAVKEVLKEEEATFSRTLKKGVAELEKRCKKLDAGGALGGADAFTMFDTYGFPLDLTVLMCEEKGYASGRVSDLAPPTHRAIAPHSAHLARSSLCRFTVDTEGYEAKMEEQKKMSQAAGKFSRGGTVVMEAEQTDALKNKMGVPPTDDSPKYVWDSAAASGAPHAATLKAVIDTGKVFMDVVDGAVELVGLCLDSTCAYAEAGGQVADVGTISGPDGASFEVSDVQKFGAYVLHIGKVTSGSFKVGAAVTLALDYGRRALIAQNHTSTHMLNLALRDALGGECDQRGSLCDMEKLRFDFAYGKPLTEAELAATQAGVNRQIDAALTIHTQVVGLEGAKAINGLRAVFGEQYPDPVRVVTVGGDGVQAMIDAPTKDEWKAYSTEFCGGTHIGNSKEASKFALLSEEGLGRGVRRVVGVTGEKAAAAFATAAALAAEAEKAAALGGKELEAAVAELVKPLEEGAVMPADAKIALRNKVNDLKKKLVEASKAGGKANAEAAKKEAEALAAANAGKPFVVALLEVEADVKVVEAAMTVLAAALPDAALLVLGAGKTAAAKGVVPAALQPKLKANEWVNAALQECGGKGGGKPASAQGAARDPSNVKAAEAAARKMAEEALA